MKFVTLLVAQNNFPQFLPSGIRVVEISKKLLTSFLEYQIRHNGSLFVT